MDAMVTVTIPGKGTYEADTHDLDEMIASHLPTTPKHLRLLVQEEAGGDWSNVYGWSTFLIVLASFETARRANG